MKTAYSPGETSGLGKLTGRHAQEGGEMETHLEGGEMETHLEVDGHEDPA